MLEKHLSDLDENRKVLAPVKDLDGDNAIVDLMLSKRIPQPEAEKLEHLIIELKRPSQVINNESLNQIQKYAYSVAEDERFRGVTAEWSFILISNDLDKYAKRSVLKQADRPAGLFHSSSDFPMKIWVKTWAQIINENKARLEFYEKSLGYKATHDSGLEYLKKTHSKYLPESLTTHAEAKVSKHKVDKKDKVVKKSNKKIKKSKKIKK